MYKYYKTKISYNYCTFYFYVHFILQRGHWKTESPLIIFPNKIIKKFLKHVFVKVIFV